MAHPGELLFLTGLSESSRPSPSQPERALVVHTLRPPPLYFFLYSVSFKTECVASYFPVEHTPESPESHQEPLEPMKEVTSP